MKNILPIILVTALLLGGCKEKPPVYERAEAIKLAQAKLVQYTQDQGLELKKFKGPFTRPL